MELHILILVMQTVAIFQPLVKGSVHANKNHVFALLSMTLFVVLMGKPMEICVKQDVVTQTKHAKENVHAKLDFVNAPPVKFQYVVLME